MSAIVTNDAFSDNGLQRVVNTSFATVAWTILALIRLSSVDFDRFATYCALGPTSFTGGNDYFVIFDGRELGVDPAFAIGSEGGDTYAADDPAVDIWYGMAYIKRSDNTSQFYYDLLRNTNSVSRNFSGDPTWASGHVLSFFTAPWAIEEGIDGRGKRLKAFNTSLTLAQCQAELTSPYLVTPSLAGNVYGLWPCISNPHDISGNNNHLSVKNTVTFDNELDPPGPRSVKVSPMPWESSSADSRFNEVDIRSWFRTASGLLVPA